MINLMKIFVRAIVRRANPVKWENLRSTAPVSTVFGLDRGQPIDRYYIEKFLTKYAGMIKGRVLEVGDDRYIKKFASDVTLPYILSYRSDEQGGRKDDLTDINSLPDVKFDSIICVQTLHVIYDFRSAIQGLNYLLNQNGTLLVTLPTLSQVSVYDMEQYGDFWRFTRKAAEMIFRNEFKDCEIKIHCYGNVLSSIAFLEGISVSELTGEELDFIDPNQAMLIGVALKKTCEA